jgi:uncharacterized membrane protein
MQGSATTPERGKNAPQETETGLDEDIAAALSYVLGFLTGLVLFLVETKNEYVRFHAAQSMVVFGGLFVVSVVLSILQTVVSFIDVVGFLLGTLFGLVNLALGLAGFALWAYLIVRTYQGADPRIPIAASVADDLR